MSVPRIARPVEQAPPRVQTTPTRVQTTVRLIQTATAPIETATMLVETTTTRIETAPTRIETTATRIQTKPPRIATTQARVGTVLPGYASTLIRDHSKGEKEVAEVVKQVSINPAAPANDTTAQETSHTIDHLRSLAGKEFDTAEISRAAAVLYDRARHRTSEAIVDVPTGRLVSLHDVPGVQVPFLPSEYGEMQRLAAAHIMWRAGRPLTAARCSCRTPTSSWHSMRRRARGSGRAECASIPRLLPTCCSRGTAASTCPKWIRCSPSTSRPVTQSGTIDRAIQRPWSLPRSTQRRSTPASSERPTSMPFRSPMAASAGA